MTSAGFPVMDQSFPIITDNVAIMIPYPKALYGTRLSVSTGSAIVNALKIIIN